MGPWVHDMVPVERLGLVEFGPRRLDMLGSRRSGSGLLAGEAGAPHARLLIMGVDDWGTSG